jgi:hypothetical protein
MREILRRGPFQAHPDTEMRETREVLCIRRIMADQNPVGLKDEMNLFGNELENP